MNIFKSFFKSSKTKTGFFKPKPKIKLFRYPSLEAPEINKAELSRLIRNTDPDNANKILRNQARSISTAVSLASGFFDTLDSEILGESGFILDIATQNRKLNTTIQNAFYEWEQNCCLHGVYDFEDYEELVLNALYRDGEAFIRIVRGDSLKIELIDADDIDNDFNDDALNIRCGIQRASKNSITPIRYYVKNSERERIGIDAKDIIHIKKPLIAKQVRGNSKLASSILDIHQKDKFKKAELNRARLSSEATGFYTRKDDGAIGDALKGWDEETGEFLESEEAQAPETVSVGTMNVLDEGYEPKFIDPHNPTNIEFYLKSTNQEIARSLGVSYSTLTGDLREVNYSSLRQGATSERRGFRRTQNFIRRKMHNVIFKEWLLIELLNGKIRPNAYNLILAHFSFKPQGWEYIDPNKEVAANAKAIESGFKTRVEVLREKGIEYDTYIDEKEKEKEIVKKLKEIEDIQNSRSDDE
ncbi:phage portal protein, lambda family [Campylobacter pinnipediorum subsp. pinnipediorum]|uniref:phage portal protein n=1 Tax=Campylobacter pinnipediorum TaxID=1965231 RepID=UPI000995A6F4|nr:phage portal protein [Campylobacter pinnipediorum]AQW81290.1 phage portal protein, lambda family [Campylobacter pinnipediorum subsp. pinnipediorum]